MKLFVKEEVNISRQFEFDLAKAVCILGMVFVHCFEELTLESTGEGAAYYIMVIVLDSLFGAGTFMISMGLGIAYSWKGNADRLIRRGVKIFLMGYALNIVRDVIADLILISMDKDVWDTLVLDLLCDDIMQFAGLALILFGLLKKAGLSDAAVLLTALSMSAVGSLVRFQDLGSIAANELAGIFIGTYSETNDEVMACFPLLNWFVIVVTGYIYANALRRCRDIHLYYSIALPVSAGFLAVYMIICIPGGLGMMNGDILYYYHFSTPNTVVLFAGTVFATSVYHFVSKLPGKGARAAIRQISQNLNRVYCVHWVFVCWTAAGFTMTGFDGLGSGAAFAVGVLIFVVSNLIAEVYVGIKDRLINADKR